MILENLYHLAASHMRVTNVSSIAWSPALADTAVFNPDTAIFVLILEG